MSPLRMGSRKVQGISAEELASRAAALRSGVESGDGQLDPAWREQAGDVLTKVEERTSKAGAHTVVALAGATGSGKSSLFNALVGSQVATVGARRPTTSRPTAAVWGEDGAAELLDWLSVGQRHHVEPAQRGEVGSTEAPAGRQGRAAGDLDGLVLLDLPDFDSRNLEHRAEAERVLALVDVFVWVTDPQKYADSRLHDDYLRALATHDAVTVVVLNQSDRLTTEQVRQVSGDLSRLAATDGMPGVQVIATSARTRAGVDELRHRLATAVAGQNAARQRLAADIRAVAGRLRTGVADHEPRLKDAADAELVDALSRAAGIPTVVSAVERDYRREAWARTGWPFTRWARAFRPDPLRRLRLDAGRSVGGRSGGGRSGGGRSGGREDGISTADVRSVLGRSSLPPASPAARSAVSLATRRVGDAAGEGLPPRWAEAVADAATPPGPELADALDQAVVGTSLRARKPAWWSVFGFLQVLLALVAVAGLLWLVVLMVLGWLQLPQIDTPRLGPLPYPFVMLVGGLLVGVLLALLARALARVGARRRGAVVRRRLTDAVSGVAHERIVAPVRGVLGRHAETRSHLDTARA